MNISILYVVSICSVILVLCIGYFTGYKHSTFFMTNLEETQNKTTAIELAEKLIKKNNLLNINIIRLKSKRTNYYSFKYNVIKLSPSVINSNLLQSLAVSANCIKDAKLSQRKTGLYMLKIAINFVSKLFTIIFIPIVLICAILDSSTSSNLPALLILIALIGYLLAILIQLILFALDLKLTNSTIKDVKSLNLLNDEEFEFFSSLCLSVCKIQFYNHTKLSLNFFSLASPDILFKQERLNQ